MNVQIKDDFFEHEIVKNLSCQEMMVLISAFFEFGKNWQEGIKNNLKNEFSGDELETHLARDLIRKKWYKDIVKFGN